MESRFPFSSYPKGWYQVEISKKITKGKIHSFNFFGKSIVCVRAEDGTVSVFDAHCPHLGAHLGVGGKVEGNNLVCPFHGWKFNTQGDCVEIPYCSKIPKRAQLQRYPVKEVNEAVFIYYSHDYREPEFDLPVFPEFSDSKWSRVQNLRYVIESHVQEMAENALDTGHFPLIHQMAEVPKIENFKMEEKQIIIRLKGVRKIFGITNTMDFELKAVGLGIVFGKTETNLMSVRAVHAATPIDNNRILVSVSYVFNKNWNPLRTLFFKLFMNREIDHFTNGDRPILAHKKYVPQPLLCTGDGPVAKLRHWARQFYEENNDHKESVRVPLSIHSIS